MMAELFIPGDIVGALEEAAVAVGRLDAALAANPLRRAWTFWSELDAARRHAEGAARSTCSGSPPTSTACRSGSATAPPPPSAAARSPA